MADWDDDYELQTSKAPVAPAKGKWEGEDEDDNDIPVLLPLQHAADSHRMTGTPSQKMRSQSL